jgi:RNA polymerase sigma-70 factor (ECF subfamily)
MRESFTLGFAYRTQYVCRSFQKDQTQPMYKTSDDRDIFEVLNFLEPSVENRIMQMQSHDRVRKMIDMLPEDQREVIILRHYADLSFKEIADLTKCSINTALGRMRYGLINMRRLDDRKTNCTIKNFPLIQPTIANIITQSYK